ncbi:DUF1014-domain-containing protein [Rhizophagus irregularis]|uniref:DUF1014-domain-containing protein n=3 Tax=Rhizophagus irregularis TaxID=588596 RepID=A0A2I1E4C1_9GLOM|nr:hypothetical protein GLOIN_2v1540279 [Rhizophagus irregularis DAOM 181602=DAOM 197198]EXX56111.1 hypothetical protein RirG_219460 [Rhizophagus irregularis DAOM 197198w]PKC17876.1 DUF1014-domain-containing protein [Rhizophagus irregularis]PKC70695.1 DUF1014-domain-containing protein [Rhizophagus irregularis]PKK72066.1 DUF1014-domain-containing protein [Rhizophagus irregularis]PKY16959.1 DUF1014-domain-containing protein [Rhizophagus irregularis]|eukprot:XP_025185092.1 hypothetical protein GLOIN_2v1540279 [Rhizophagus irregularis DAOM 181602=DAOM 197198]
MPKKFRGENTKVTAAKEKKAVHQKEVNSKKQAEKERKESEEWSVGAKDTSKKEAQRLRKEAQLAKKNEAAKLLEQEEKELSKYKPVIKLTKKSGEETKAIKKTQKVEQEATERREIPEFSASNIDDALDLLENNGGGAPTSASNIERHPERRFKAAFRAYEEHEMPKLRKENPGLRYAQLHNLLYENFKKSPENPFNQTNVLRYNASKNEEIDLIETTRKNIEDRLRV